MGKEINDNQNVITSPKKRCVKCNGECRQVKAPPKRKFAYDYICESCGYVNILGTDIPFNYYI